MRIEELIELCDRELRSGQAASVRQRISALEMSEVARAWRLPLARICRRANLFVVGLRLLRPLFFQGRNQWYEGASPAETCEYAALLSKNGNNEEALRMLSKIPVEKVAESALYTAFCFMAKWDYARCAEELRKYLRTSPPEYQALLAKVNLAACQVNNGEWNAADENLAEIKTICRRENHIRLLANANELSGQLALHQTDWAAAREHLNEAAKLLASDTTYDRLFIEKWDAILGGLEAGSEEPILAFREKARERHHWESMREADRFSLQIRFDQPRFDYLYFGTPYENYRRKLAQDLGVVPAQPEYILGGGRECHYDFVSGRVNGVEADSGSLRVFSALLMDFYRPISPGGLFSQLFPGDHFDPLSSPHRVHQTLWRARQWLAKNKYPLRLVANDGAISIAHGSEVSFKIPLNWTQVEDLWMVRLRAHVGGREFTAEEACEILQMPRSSFHRKAKAGIEQSRLLKRFSGSATRYRLKA